MNTYQNKGCKLIPFTGNVLNSFVLSEKVHRLSTNKPKSEQGNEDVLLTKMENMSNKQHEGVTKEIKKYHPN